MSLKAFHLVFIVASILLAVGFAVWSLFNFLTPTGTMWDMAMGVGAILAAVGLVCYERFFLKKFKNVSYL